MLTMSVIREKYKYSLSSFKLLLRRSDLRINYKFFINFNVFGCGNPCSQLPIRALMPWKLVVNSIVFNVLRFKSVFLSCYIKMFK